MFLLHDAMHKHSTGQRLASVHLSVCLSVCLSVQHTLVLYQNGQRYLSNFFLGLITP